MQWGTDNSHPDLAEQRERLSAWLDGALDSAERATLERHVDSCAWCRHELAALRQTRELLRALPEPRLPRSFALPLAGPLPVAPAEEHAPLRVTFAPTSAAALTGAPASRSARSASRWAGVVQRVGGLAAAIGLSLLVGNAILSQSTQNVNGPQGASAGVSVPSGTGTGTNQGPSVGVPGKRYPTPGTSGSHDLVNGTQGDTSSPPVLPLAGAGLLGGGTIMLVAGLAAARRDKQNNAA